MALAIGGLSVTNPLASSTPGTYPGQNIAPVTNPGTYPGNNLWQLTSNQASAPVSSPTQSSTLAPVLANTGTTTPSASTQPGGASGYNASGYSSSTGTYRPDLVAALQGNYNSINDQLNGHIDSLNQIYGTQQHDLDNTYNAQNNQLQHQHALGQSNLDQSQVQQDAAHANSLRDLANQFRGAVNGYSNQLGNYGAGNSSAVGMINYALGQQANRNRGDIQQQAGFNQTNLNQSRAGLDTGYQDQLAQLESWKQQQLNSLAGAYTQGIQGYQDQIRSAKGNQAVQDALYNLPGAQDALSQLQALDAQYGNHLAALQGAYHDHSIDPSFANQAAGYQANPITPQQLSTLGLSNQTASYANPQQTINIKRPEQYSTPSY